MGEQEHPLTDPAERRLHLASATIRGGGTEQVCVVCARSLVETHTWGSYACKSCGRLDRSIAEVLGGRRFLALGRQVLMNGFGVEVATSPSGITRAAEVLEVQTTLWAFQVEWCRREVSRLAARAGFGGVSEVRWADWSSCLPASAAASAESYGLLLLDHYGWILEQDPRVWSLVFLPADRGRPSSGEAGSKTNS